jgi:hypothetical protein
MSKLTDPKNTKVFVGYYTIALHMDGGKIKKPKKNETVTVDGILFDDTCAGCYGECINGADCGITKSSFEKQEFDIKIFVAFKGTDNRSKRLHSVGKFVI